MKPAPRRLAVAAVSCALLLGACTGDDPDDDPTTLPPDDAPSTDAPSPTATEAASPTPAVSPTGVATATPSDDPFAVPDEIDAAYVERVLGELDRLDAATNKAILETDVDPAATELPAQFSQPTRDIYGEPLLALNLRTKLALVRSEDERADLLPPGERGQVRTSIEAVLDSSTCIVARGRSDFSEVDAEIDGDPELVFFFLAPSDANRTGWRLHRVVEDQSDDPVSDDEMRSVTIEDLAEFYPEACS